MSRFDEDEDFGSAIDLPAKPPESADEAARPEPIDDDDCEYWCEPSDRQMRLWSARSHAGRESGRSRAAEAERKRVMVQKLYEKLLKDGLKPMAARRAIHARLKARGDVVSVRTIQNYTSPPEK
jgi:hypothetical protein